MPRELAIVFFELSLLGMAPPLFGESTTKQPVRVASVQRVNFAAGGTIRINDSFDYLNVEGWDRPEVDIMVIKSTDRYYEPGQQEQAARRLERVGIVAERRSDTELAISTTLPSRGSVFSPLLPGTTKGGVMLEYEIRAPRDSRLVIHHRGGLIFVSNMAGDIEATSRSGDIVLTLQDDVGKYSIDAKSRLGSVSSDFGASHNVYLVGGRFAYADSSSAQRIYLRMGFGGITIKNAWPKPEALVTRSIK